MHDNIMHLVHHYSFRLYERMRVVELAWMAYRQTVTYIIAPCSDTLQDVRNSCRRDGDVRAVSFDKADLGTSQALENHALLVMNALDEAITNMDDPEFLVEMLLTTGKSHQRFENFSMQIFWVSVLMLSPFIRFYCIFAAL